MQSSTRIVAWSIIPPTVHPEKQRGGRRAAFSARTTIDREDFGLTWNVALETGGVLVSPELRLEIDLAVVSAAAEAEAEDERLSA